MVAGGSNLFFFFQANSGTVFLDSASHLKQKELRRKLKPQDYENLGFATIYSYTWFIFQTLYPITASSNLSTTSLGLK
jgi:hypothetical protein